jgi:hypothetical protein
LRLPYRAALVLLVAGAGLALLGNNIGQDRAEIGFDGHVILTLRVGWGGLSVQQRADVIQQRLLRVMEWEFENQAETPVVDQTRIRPVGDSLVISCGPLDLISVTPLDARANRSTAAGLAQLWRKRIAEVLVIATQTG